MLDPSFLLQIFHIKLKKTTKLKERGAEMERKTYDQNLIDRVAKYEAGMANPTITSEEAAVMAKEEYWQNVAKHQMRTLDLIAKLDELEGDFMTHEQCVWMANDIMRIIPPELEQNMDEWLDDKPLTEIELHGKTVKDVMTQFGQKQNITFLEVIKCFGHWRAEGYKNDDFCRWYFASM